MGKPSPPEKKLYTNAKDRNWKKRNTKTIFPQSETICGDWGRGPQEFALLFPML